VAAEAKKGKKVLAKEVAIYANYVCHQTEAMTPFFVNSQMCKEVGIKTLFKNGIPGQKWFEGLKKGTCN
jgi:hypothetical protein